MLMIGVTGYEFARRAVEAYRFTYFSSITSSWRHNDFISHIWVQIWAQSIKLSSYAKFQLIIFKYRLRYCNVANKNE